MNTQTSTSSTASDSVRDDLAFVSASIERDKRSPDVPAIYALWAVIFPIGFALPDFAPVAAGLFWPIAGIGGGLLSMWLGYRHERICGRVDAEEGKRHGFHWLVGGFGFFGIYLPGLAGTLPWATLAHQFVLMSAVVYGLAAVHLNRPLAIPAIIMGLGYIALSLISIPYVWTASGLLIGMALLITAFITHAQQRGAA